MMTERMATIKAAFIAATLAAGMSFSLLAANTSAPVRAADKEKNTGITDPALEYLKGHEPSGDRSFGVSACLSCHNEGGMKRFIEKHQSDQFIITNEGSIWEEKDIHAAAMKCLTQPLGEQMSEILKKNRPAGYHVSKAAECLTCHSVDASPHTPLADKKYDDFATAEGGVNCVACHGLHQKWQYEHFVEPKQAGQAMPWRAKTPAYKYEAGMHDLRNPVVKANLCASCHIGNHAEGKVVTHEMYAAGHPPLPPFELASYMEGQPRHWGYPTDLKYFESVKPSDTWKLFHFHPAKTESYLARNFAVGAIVGLRAEAELLLAEGKRAAETGEGLDFARFDCYSCHHELKFPSERQKRGYDGPPGRPPLRAAIGVPAELVARHAESVDGLKAKSAGFDAKWLALRKAALAKPFGDPAKVQAEAKATKEWCDAFLKLQSESETQFYSPAQAERLRAMVAETATGVTAIADPEAAMNLTWAARTLALEAKTPLSGDKLKTLEAIIPLNVRNSPFSQMVGKYNVPVQAQYPERMKKIATFESAKFVDAFNGVFNKPK